GPAPPIVGLAGLVGAGRSERAATLFGVTPPLAGTVEVAGKTLAMNTPHDAISAGIALVPEDRKRYGLIVEMTVSENLSLAGLRIGQIIGYALVVETIFGWPGLGQVLVNAVLRRDYPVAQFFSLVLITIVVLSNWLADVGYTIVNPRLRKA
ncbi:MAG: ABC transporter permease subunit, partial [Proteobacteria bacterium]|nr:ABC transporter permease subunit [Pseudomonadota bacterium]